MRRPGRGGREAVALRASRRLGLLDEHGVPYAAGATEGGDASWASLDAGGPGRGLHWYTGEGAQGGWRTGPLRIFAAVAGDAATARFAATLPGDWTREVELVGRDRAWIWRSREGGSILPFDPDDAVANLRSERYQRLTRRGGARGRALARRGYYAVRPALPRRVQIALRRTAARAQQRTEFPRWPVESALHDLVDLVLQRVADAAGAGVPRLAAWPAGHSWALVLTHDVETAAGRDAIESVRALEAGLGYRSSWNLVPERYEVPDELVAHLQRAGCEVGVHGLRHDGRDIDPLRTMLRRLPEMRRWAERWGAVGFRAPATHRVWERMPQLGFEYDTSYPDTDPFEPMAGGSCSWLPFFNDGMVELPITLPQDHTVFTILRRDESLWRDKADFLRTRGGMALLIVHPDYADERLLAAYEEFLSSYRDDGGVWTALPHEVAAWWRRRAATSVQLEDGEWRAVGAGADEADIEFAEPAPEWRR